MVFRPRLTEHSIHKLLLSYPLKGVRDPVLSLAHAHTVSDGSLLVKRKAEMSVHDIDQFRSNFKKLQIIEEVPGMEMVDINPSSPLNVTVFDMLLYR